MLHLLKKELINTVRTLSADIACDFIRISYHISNMGIELIKLFRSEGLNNQAISGKMSTIRITCAIFEKMLNLLLFVRNPINHTPLQLH